VARDSQGRVRREVTRQTPDGKTQTHVTISDPVAGTVTELDTANKIAYSHQAHFPTQQQIQARQQSMQTANPRGVRQPAQNNPNIKRETLAAQSIAGVTATGSRITHTIPAGAIGNSATIETVQETWMSDDLKIPVRSHTTDPRSGTSSMEM